MRDCRCPGFWWSRTTPKSAKHSRMMLAEAGYAAVTVSDPASALAIFRQQQPDAVVTDIVMPECDGFELIREMRALDPKVKIIAISGGAMISTDYYLRTAKSLGASATLAKPFGMAELVAAVRGCAPGGAFV